MLLPRLVFGWSPRCWPLARSVSPLLTQPRTHNAHPALGLVMHLRLRRKDPCVPLCGSCMFRCLWLIDSYVVSWLGQSAFGLHCFTVSDGVFLWPHFHPRKSEFDCIFLRETH
ncbi:hypothetical protein, unlikely [Trypanosoma brucei gambiense DAL972]|uniref:Uncharacterized protein n=1 Tax=Trypanosoma brucei gambiense (strain MHOM/CI/86/DAL972) TaxID=679716 RepID=D0A4M8_TRYB9|nr:hypothetical protein, unlikely [Trypanosoma brucei gambiense DAL972]CBH16222.1 hypothetical protein, unlikely [Trypanosoma brucei gambiense DAL972]|eukprot:XP_011778486.1 hypothetical protein, unlikely [Trypanosoma brucei gambiense DAL972]